MVFLPCGDLTSIITRQTPVSCTRQCVWSRAAQEPEPLQLHRALSKEGGATSSPCNSRRVNEENEGLNTEDRTRFGTKEVGCPPWSQTYYTAENDLESLILLHPLILLILNPPALKHYKTEHI